MVKATTEVLDISGEEVTSTITWFTKVSQAIDVMFVIRVKKVGGFLNH